MSVANMVPGIYKWKNSLIVVINFANVIVTHAFKCACIKMGAFFSQANTLIDYVKYLVFDSDPRDVLLRNGLICMLIPVSLLCENAAICIFSSISGRVSSQLWTRVGCFNGPSILFLCSLATSLTKSPGIALRTCT